MNTQQDSRQQEQWPPQPFINFLKKRVRIPVWAIIITVFIMVSLVTEVYALNAFSSITITQDSSNITGTTQNDQTPQPTLAPASVPTKAPQPTPVPSPTPIPSPTPKSPPTQSPKWTVVHTFTGNGNKKTSIFSVPDDWKMIWHCNPASSFDGSYNLIVDVNNSDTTSLDVGAINTICQSGNITDNTEEHQGGDVYLDIVSESWWSIEIQMLQ